MRINFVMVITLLIVNATILPVIWTAPNEDKKYTVDCYDDNHNKIIGIECEEITTGISQQLKIMWTLIVLLACIAFFLIHLSIINRRN